MLLHFCFGEIFIDRWHKFVLYVKYSSCFFHICCFTFVSRDSLIELENIPHVNARSLWPTKEENMGGIICYGVFGEWRCQSFIGARIQIYLLEKHIWKCTEAWPVERYNGANFYLDSVSSWTFAEQRIWRCINNSAQRHFSDSAENLHSGFSCDSVMEERTLFFNS